MIALALLLIAQASTDLADEANGAYVQCLFARSRAANEARLSLSEFEGRLASSCAAEEQTSVRATAAVLARRGERNAAGTARRLAASARQQVIDSYRRAIELEPELRKIGDLCRAQPERCRN